MYFYGFIVPTLSFFLQIWPRLINRYFGIDTWRHLMYADYVRQHHKFPKQIRDRYMVIGPYGYPPVIIKILSLFPKSFDEKYQFVFSPAFDFIHNFLIFYFARALSQNISVAISAQVIAALTPVAVIEASNLNTRVISYLIFSLSFFPLILFSTTQSYVWLLVAFLGLALLFYTHRFAIQAYLFCVTGLSIIERNPFYLLFFLATFAVVYVLGGEFYQSVLNEHLALLNFWRKNIDLRFAHQFRGVMKPKMINDFINKIYNYSFKNPLIFILGNNPWLGIYSFTLIFLFFYRLSPQVINIQIVGKLHIWVLVLLTVSLLISSIKQLRFLGEGYRYLEYAIFPMSLLLGSYFPMLYQRYGEIFLTIFIVICLAMFTAIIFLQKKTIVEDRMRTITDELWEIINYLNRKLGKEVRLGVFPVHLGDAMMYFLSGRVLITDSVFGLEKLKDLFPVVRKPLDEIIKKYRLNYILFDETYVTLAELAIKNKKVVKSLNKYVLLKV